MGAGNEAVIYKVTGRVGTIVPGTLQRKVASVCTGETNLARIWRLTSFCPLDGVQRIPSSASYILETWGHSKWMCSRDMERNALDWPFPWNITDSVTEVWMGQKFSRAFGCLCKRLFQNLAGRTRVPAASWELFLLHSRSE